MSEPQNNPAPLVTPNASTDNKAKAAMIELAVQDNAILVLDSFIKSPSETVRLIEEQGANLDQDKQQPWKAAYSRSAICTATYFFAAFLAQIAVTIFFVSYDPTGTRLAEWQWLKSAIFFIIWLLVIVGRFVIELKFNEWVKNNPIPTAEDLAGRRKWHNDLSAGWPLEWHVYLNLFALRNIWLWTLLVGTTANFIDFLRGTEINAMIFSQDLARALLISLIAYIATNVVREMLDMRVRYQKSLQTMEKITTTLNNQYDAFNGQTQKVNEATGKLDDQVKSFGQMTKALGAQAESIVANTQLEQGIKNLLSEASTHSDSKLAEAIFQAFGNFGKEADAIAKRISGIKEEKIRRMYLNALNPYLQTELDAFDSQRESPKNRGIVTRFSAVGQMVRSLLVNCNELDVTFHALLVIPPVRFLNYSHPSNFLGEWGNLWLGDKNWNDYLGENFEVAKHGLVQRQFLVVVESDENTGALSSEAKTLNKKYVTTQLGLWVECENGLPISSDKVGSVGKKWYRMEKEKPTSGSWERLADILGKTYHSSGNCFIREIAAEKLIEEPLSDIGKLLKDSDTQKPYDYFAARCKKTKEWVFCLKMRYDKDFDVAILEILYANNENQAGWEMTKQDLNKLFPDTDSKEIIEITKYADQNPPDSTA